MEVINGIYISDGTMENADDIDRHIIEALRSPEINRQTAAKLLKGYIDMFLRNESDVSTTAQQSHRTGLCRARQRTELSQKTE